MEALTRLEQRRPGTSIAFVDAPTGEVVLSIASDADGQMCVEFHLYDAAGHPVAESAATSTFPNGIKIHSEDGDLLLDLPGKFGENIIYRLYNRNGELLTSSNGVLTRIGPCLRMQSVPAGNTARPPRRPVSNQIL